MKKYTDYIVEETCKILAIDSPSGYTDECVDFVMSELREMGYAPVKTVKGGVVLETPDRKLLQAVQTPQVFDFELLRGALKKAKEDGAEVTDDCSAVERLGMSVKIVEGDEKNIKVTTPMDLKIAELFLEEMK